MSTTAVPANSPSVWDTPIIIGAVFAILAILLELPGAILAVKELRRCYRPQKGDVERGNVAELDNPTCRIADDSVGQLRD
ncbi:hypothetical protein P171DRAFT_479147 [Karstenula rhodostoma CBS 690.94]|uniref:Uncharacterized protein n=1 Tax=Karstenula rhodostoma CBS 690.94 TaxID=1392251 RepID=A0A9P4UK99_9PLEO|nr:hypothetical protein P171DRAFT_479147 [Karstenula rhodostoma CBS 690.94]